MEPSTPQAPWGDTPTIAEAGLAFRAGRLSPVELLDDCLARVHAREQDIHAFIELDTDRARAAARCAERELRSGMDRGPLHGIPVGLKDLIDVRGWRTTAHSGVRRHAPLAQQDARAWSSLEAAGAILVGKLGLHEFALGGSLADLPWPLVRNPWDTGLGINGSSSGSAAAVAAGFVLGALGTDTGGSIRAPALCCGIAGLKPAAGAVPATGVFPLSPTLDIVGPLARTTQDCALMYKALTGSGLAADDSGGLRNLRVGLPARWIEQESPPSAPLTAALEAALRTLQRSGARVIEVRLAPMRDFVTALSLIMLKEGWDVHAPTLARHYADYGRTARVRLMAGALIGSPAYRAALQLRAALTRKTAAAMQEVDVLITPGGSALASPIDSPVPPHALLAPSYTRPFSVTGQACLIAPVQGTADPMPLGVQLVAHPGREGLLFAIGRLLQGSAA
jgi:aspartyl-tRNA(Asn)/glutamyl-tRNA(Gln) amidotransferase subunit A